MARPINSAKGLRAFKALYLVDASGNTTQVTGNSTGMIFNKGLKLTGTFQISGTSRVFTADSTGVKLGTRYISTNGTGNVTT